MKNSPEAEKLPVKVCLVVLDETLHWCESIVRRAGRIYSNYFYDANEVTYCCSAVPCYTLYPIDTTYLLDQKTEAEAEKLGDQISESADLDIVYMSCSDVKRLPDTQKEEWETVEVPEDETREEVLEGYEEYFRGNSVLSTPSNWKALQKQVRAEMKALAKCMAVGE